MVPALKGATVTKTVSVPVQVNASVTVTVKSVVCVRAPVDGFRSDVCGTPLTAGIAAPVLVRVQA